MFFPCKCRFKTNSPVALSYQIATARIFLSRYSRATTELCAHSQSKFGYPSPYSVTLMFNSCTFTRWLLVKKQKQKQTNKQNKTKKNPKLYILWKWKQEHKQNNPDFALVMYLYKGKSFNVSRPALCYHSCIFFNWSIIDLQCCISFRCSAQWFIYIFFSYTYFFSVSFPI